MHKQDFRVFETDTGKLIQKNCPVCKEILSFWQNEEDVNQRSLCANCGVESETSILTGSNNKKIKINKNIQPNIFDENDKNFQQFLHSFVNDIIKTENKKDKKLDAKQIENKKIVKVLLPKKFVNKKIAKTVSISEDFNSKLSSIQTASSSQKNDKKKLDGDENNAKQEKDNSFFSRIKNTFNAKFEELEKEKNELTKKKL